MTPGLVAEIERNEPPAAGLPCEGCQELPRSRLEVAVRASGIGFWSSWSWSSMTNSPAQLLKKDRSAVSITRLPTP